MTERESLAIGENYRKGSWKAFRFVLPYLKPHLRRLSLVCLIDISIVLLNLVIPWFGKALIDEAFPTRNWSQVGNIAISVAGLALLVFALVGARTFLYNATEQLLQLDIRRAMYGHLQKLSLDTVESLSVGQQQFRISTDPDRIAHMLVRILPTLTMVVEFALILAATVAIDPILPLIVSIFLIPWTAMFIGVTHIGRVLDRRRLRLAETRDAGILQAASSFATIKGYGRERFEVLRNGRVSLALQRVANQGYLILVFFEFITQRLIGGSSPYLKTTTIYLLLARKVVLGEMTLGATVPMLAYLTRLTFPIERIVNFGCWIWQTMVSAERMMHIMETEPAIQDAAGAKDIGPLQGSIQFENVTFERDGVGTVIDGLDLDIPAGKRVAIVGPSGAGKSTMLGLALRLIDPMVGRVLFDGVDLKSVKRDSVVRQIGSVLQDTFIFGGTVRDNLRLGNLYAADDQMVDALAEVELSDWLEGLPDGLDHDLESGVALSVGQKQRLGVARALLTNGKIYLLDEPTSALDPRTENGVTNMLMRVTEGKTVVLVTHRLRTVEQFDEIIVLSDGKIVERGTHNELLQMNGTYSRMLTTFDRSGLKTG